MKKIISIMLTVCMLSAGVLVPVQAADRMWERDSDTTALLSALGIMEGDDNGDFMLDSYVTRAQMAKVAVLSSSYKNTVAVGIQFSPFSDVRGTHWSAPYIRAAVSAGIVEGYIDGTFLPDGAVTLEEAVTMMLRVLGYTADDFGASYPYGQMAMANSLKMTAGIPAAVGDSLTRREVARLVCNTLNTKSKTMNMDLISVHDCEFIEDVTIISTSADDSALADNEVSTSAGTYKTDDSFNNNYIGCSGDMVVRDNKYLIAFSSDTDTETRKYVIYSTLADAILCYPEGNNKTLEQFKISGDAKCYKGSQTYSYQNLLGMMEMGDIVRIRLRNDGTVDYMSYSEGNLTGPLKVISSAWYEGIANDATRFVRDGKTVGYESIQLNDIIYYSSSLNMVMAYTTKATGVYQDAIPSKDSPNSVVISGVTYEIEGAEAFTEFSSGGSINYGDAVTVLFGRDGKKIAGVITDNAQASMSVTGYVLSTGKKTFTNADNSTYTSHYAELVTADGTIYEYPTSTDKSSMINTVCRVSIKNGVATLSHANSSALSGEADYEKMTIGGKRVATDVRIIDIAKTSTSSVPAFAKTYMQRLDGIDIQASRVLYYNINSTGEINELILQNVTGDAFSFGIMTGTDDRGFAKVESNNAVYTTASKYLAFGEGVMFIANGNRTEYTASMKKIAGMVSEITTGNAVIGGKTYRYGDKVLVYKVTGTEHMQISVNEIVNGNYKCTFYTDDTNPVTGRIRVIVAR